MYQNYFYNAQGELKPKPTPTSAISPISSVTVEGFQPAYVSDDAKKTFWEERSANGYPFPSTEWQMKGHEKHGRVSDPKNAAPPTWRILFNDTSLDADNFPFIIALPFVVISLPTTNR